MAFSVPEDWLPTPDNINALPDGLRRYIHDVEDQMRPAGRYARAIPVARGERDAAEGMRTARQVGVEKWKLKLT